MNSAAFTRSLLPALLLSTVSAFAQDSTPLSLDAPAATSPTPEFQLNAPADSSAAPAASPTPPPALPGLDASKFADPIAKVNGKPISRRDFEVLANGVLASQGGTIGQVPPDQRADFYRDVLQQMVTERLINEKAINQEVPEAEIDAEIAKLKAQFPDEQKYQEQLAAAGKNEDLLRLDLTTRKRQQKYLESQIKPKVNVSDADAKKFYEENPNFFKAPDALRANQIVILVPEDATVELRAEKMKKAKSLSEQLIADPSKFDEMVKTESEDPKAKQNGGDTGHFSRERFPFPEFYDAVDKMKVGEVSEPLRTPVGFHVVKLTEKKAARTIPYDEAKPRVKDFISSQKREEEFQKLVAALRKGAKIEILEEKLVK